MSLTPPTTTPLDKTALQSLLARQRNHASSVRAQTAAVRIGKLKSISEYLEREENKAALIAALQRDFGKPEVETLLSEIGVVLSHIRYVTKRLKQWMEPEKLSVPLSLTGMRNYVYKEPKGSVLIIAPWNYPFNLTMVPLIYAVAAGCTAVVKPSELSPATTEYMRQMLDQLFPPEEIKVVTGEGDTSAFLTTLDFDHIFFTGSPAIGKKVMAAAAQNLTSVTLELGGKSPAVIDKGINLKKSAANSVWGKFFNAGQTCIAPDYLLVHQSIVEDYVVELKAAIVQFYGKDARSSDSLARIISDRHFQRIKALIDDAVAKGATVAHGGQTDAAERFIAPTILTGATEDMDIMQEEIFGPVWPVMTYKNLDEAIQIINRQPKALAFYIQSDRRKTIRRLLAGTSSGGALVNEYLLGGGSASVPFGGVNNSGIGKSFGYHGFIEFTNERPVMERRFLDLSMAYPPYSDKVVGLVRKIYGWL